MPMTKVRAAWMKSFCELGTALGKGAPKVEANEPVVAPIDNDNGGGAGYSNQMVEG